MKQTLLIRIGNLFLSMAYFLINTSIFFVGGFHFAQAQTGTVNVNRLNFREAPSLEAPVFKQFPQGTKIEILQKHENWYHIRQGEQEGYIFEEYITLDEIGTKKDEIPIGTSFSLLETGEFLIHFEQWNAYDILHGEEKSDTPLSQKSISEKKIKTSEPQNVSFASQVVTIARQYEGYRYVYGGASPSTGFDCSGFVHYVLKKANIQNTRTSSRMLAGKGTFVLKNHIRAGDLVFFDENKNGVVDHVGIALDKDNFIHAINPSAGIGIDNIHSSHYASRYVTARRLF